MEKGSLKELRYKDSMLAVEEIDKLKKEIKEFRKTGIPRCFHCQKPFINGIDSITKKECKYTWVPTCKCVKDMVLCRG